MTLYLTDGSSKGGQSLGAARRLAHLSCSAYIVDTGHSIETDTLSSTPAAFCHFLMLRQASRVPDHQKVSKNSACRRQVFQLPDTLLALAEMHAWLICTAASYCHFLIRNPCVRQIVLTSVRGYTSVQLYQPENLAQAVLLGQAFNTSSDFTWYDDTSLQAVSWCRVRRCKKN